MIIPFERGIDGWTYVRRALKSGRDAVAVLYLPKDMHFTVHRYQNALSQYRTCKCVGCLVHSHEVTIDMRNKQIRCPDVVAKLFTHPPSILERAWCMVRRKHI